MNLVFSGSNSTEIEFKVGIAGTATTPQRVTAVLEQDGISLSFPAKEDGGVWRAIVSNVGQVFREGLANFSINVILNDKIFVPLTNKVTIATETPVSIDLVDKTTEVAPQPNIAPQLAIEQASVNDIIDENLVKSEIPQELPIKQEESPKPQVSTPKFSLLRSIEPVNKPKAAPKKVIAQSRAVTESIPKVTLFKLKRTKVVTE